MKIINFRQAIAKGGNVMYELFNLIIKTTSKNTMFHGYRTATTNVIMVFDREDEKIKQLEEHLYMVTNAMKDNHVLFEVKLNGNILALQFTDGEMWLGLGVEKVQW
jgi:hypothetical protein